MTVELRVGGASDVGRLRDVNQDAMLLGPAVYAVADGMGGHAAGDVAARLTVETLESATGGDATLRVADLVEAIQSANDVVFEQSATVADYAGMGTTVVAVAIVEEDDEERIAILNVGDSRAYRYSEGELTQISDDHSYVGDLLRDGSITKAQAREHPRKNIVTRAIGIDPYVDVDDFQILPRRGDRYVLCSDGLTDELDEDAIATVLRTNPDPGQAADELVRQANAHGGRDNITVVVVEVVDDGLTDAARAALPDDILFSHHPDADTQGFMAVPDDVAHLQNEGPDPLTDTGEIDPVTLPAPEAASEAGPRARAPRVVTVRSLGFVVAVLVIVGGGLFLSYNYARNTFHVGVDNDGLVTIYQGRVGGFLWFDPTVVEHTDLEVDDLFENVQDDLREGVSQPTRTDAETYVENLADQRKPTTTTTTTIPPRTTTTIARSTTTAVGGP